MVDMAQEVLIKRKSKMKIDDIKQKIENLEIKIALLRESLKVLESEQSENDPNFQRFYKYESPFTPQIPYWTEVTSCPTCGLQFSGVMGYCCPNTKCPTGLGPVMC